MATFLRGDCLEVMKTLPDKSIDCFLVDLPYGQLSHKALDIPNTENRTRKACPATVRDACDWDVKLDLTAFWAQVKRLCRNDHTPVLMFCNAKFGFELYASNPSWFRYDLVWDKARGVSFLLANKMPLKSHEMVYVFSKKGAFYKRTDEHNGKDLRCALSVLRCPGRGQHPTEKPLELYDWLLRRYCPEGGTVLDPTAGSFNAIAAARALKLKAIGIEKHPKFFWNAVASIVSEPPLRNDVVLTS